MLQATRRLSLTRIHGSQFVGRMSINKTPNGAASQSREVSTSSEKLLKLGHKHVTNGLGRLTEGIMAKGNGSYVEYEDGKRLLDFSTGIGVTSLGTTCQVTFVVAETNISRQDIVTPKSVKPPPSNV
ncbi:hypothetical protein DXG03_006281 [Asterophora parasitica]|uniref:Uncharacterized protein n=1 Tax=Asterophora parasitica TaxID=117018 RepID=A0A9P7KAN8_9AGAR|nr:hypothetical protein DXG03_006281 [Asterophora parasitica]